LHLGKKDVNGRDEPGHDDAGTVTLFGRHCHGKQRQIKPETGSPFG
jgi:hypothetical protein